MPRRRKASHSHVERARKDACRLQALEARLDCVPVQPQEIAGLGLRKVVDYQDNAYGGQYLEMVERAAKADTAPFDLTLATAQYAANALCYDDILRVADLKTRVSRHQRLRAEVRVKDDQLVQLTEYFHPRLEEFTTTLPVSLGAWLQKNRRAKALYTSRPVKGRRIRTDSVLGFGMKCLHCARWRRSLPRHQSEMAHITAWFYQAMNIAATDRTLAAEVLANRRPVKGYSDTHARGLSQFDRVMSALPMLRGRPDAADLDAPVAHSGTG
ncbi:Indolepyruvate oxidoreductase subunit B (plasmid) [Aminobacter aminovorans]|jgi:indolepyruvate ferredoxin oxidoreductase beta subunit|nr:Indolepyruvate oxidoreductase subunit B [Aminobacter aminovorans]